MVELQRSAAMIVGRVLAGRSLDAELRALWSREQDLAPQDRGALQDVCYGALRFLGEIDEALERLLVRPLKDEDLRQLLRVAVYQLAHTRAAPYAVVDHAVRATVALGRAPAKGLVNGVLRNFLRRRDTLLDEALSTDRGRYSHPTWWIAKLRAQYPERYGGILDIANSHPPLTLRVNVRATTVESYTARLRTSGIGAQHLGGTAVTADLRSDVDVTSLAGAVGQSGTLVLQGAPEDLPEAASRLVEGGLAVEPIRNTELV